VNEAKQLLRALSEEVSDDISSHSLPTQLGSQRCRSAQALLTLCLGYSVTFLLSLLMSNHNSSFIRLCYAKAVNFTQLYVKGPNRSPRNPDRTVPEINLFNLKADSSRNVGSARTRQSQMRRSLPARGVGSESL
jgi:hypothetical protein